MAKTAAVANSIILDAILVPRQNGKLKPVCPVCMSDPNPFSLKKVQAIRKAKKEIVEVLTLPCRNEKCPTQIRVEYEAYVVEKTTGSEEVNIEEDGEVKKRGRKKQNRYHGTDILFPAFVKSHKASADFIAEYKSGSVKSGVWRNNAGIAIEEPIENIKKSFVEVKEPVEEVKEVTDEQPKRRRGRPRKNPEPLMEATVEQPEKKKRGRSLKNPDVEPVEKKNRGRPKKTQRVDEFAAAAALIQNGVEKEQRAMPKTEREKVTLTITRDENEFLIECDNAKLRALYPANWKRSGIVLEIPMEQLGEVETFFGHYGIVWMGKLDLLSLDPDYGSQTVTL